MAEGLSVVQHSVGSAAGSERSKASSTETEYFDLTPRGRCLLSAEGAAAAVAGRSRAVDEVAKLQAKDRERLCAFRRSDKSSSLRGVAGGAKAGSAIADSAKRCPKSCEETASGDEDLCGKVRSAPSPCRQRQNTQGDASPGPRRQKDQEARSAGWSRQQQPHGSNIPGGGQHQSDDNVYSVSSSPFAPSFSWKENLRTPERHKAWQPTLTVPAAPNLRSESRGRFTSRSRSTSRHSERSHSEPPPENGARAVAEQVAAWPNNLRGVHTAIHTSDGLEAQAPMSVGTPERSTRSACTSRSASVRSARSASFDATRLTIPVGPSLATERRAIRGRSRSTDRGCGSEPSSRRPRSTSVRKQAPKVTFGQSHVAASQPLLHEKTSTKDNRSVAQTEEVPVNGSAIVAEHSPTIRSMAAPSLPGPRADLSNTNLATSASVAAAAPISPSLPEVALREAAAPSMEASDVAELSVAACSSTHGVEKKDTPAAVAVGISAPSGKVEAPPVVLPTVEPALSSNPTSANESEVMERANVEGRAKLARQQAMEALEKIHDCQRREVRSNLEVRVSLGRQREALAAEEPTVLSAGCANAGCSTGNLDLSTYLPSPSKTLQGEKRAPPLVVIESTPAEVVPQASPVVSTSLPDVSAQGGSQAEIARQLAMEDFAQMQADAKKRLFVFSQSPSKSAPPRTVKSSTADNVAGKISRAGPEASTFATSTTADKGADGGAAEAEDGETFCVVRETAAFEEKGGTGSDADPKTMTSSAAVPPASDVPVAMSPAEAESNCVDVANSTANFADVQSDGHKFNKQMRAKLEARLKIVESRAAASTMTTEQDDMASDSQLAARLLGHVVVCPFGVLGTQLAENGEVKRKAQEPGPQVAILDPAGLAFISGGVSGGPSAAGGASGSIYEWLGIRQDAAFPEPVRAAISSPLAAKHHCYVASPPSDCVEVASKSRKHCIHVVGPDFRSGPRKGEQQKACQSRSREQAVAELAEAYNAVFAEFLASGACSLRILPISGGIFAGRFAHELPSMTAEALARGFAQLEIPAQSSIWAASVKMCIFKEAEFAAYAAAFQAPQLSS